MSNNMTPSDVAEDLMMVKDNIESQIKDEKDWRKLVKLYKQLRKTRRKIHKYKLQIDRREDA